MIELVYCRGPVLTFDGIPVRFKKRDFDHAFFGTVNNKDDTFSVKRAQRMDWIKAALQDPGAERYMGWDRKKKKHNPSRRVCVGIALKKKGGADFITAYVADMKNTGHDQKKSALEIKKLLILQAGSAEAFLDSAATDRELKFPSKTGQGVKVDFMNIQPDGYHPFSATVM